MIFNTISFCSFVFFLTFAMCVASPASGKLGLRMTTLHEEPASRHTLTEEMEENYSDSELNQFHDDSAVRKPPLKSRFPTSKTMGSLRDIGNSFQSMTSSANISHTVTKNVRKNATNASNNKQVSGTPTMVSSTSSGYGSQVIFFQHFMLFDAKQSLLTHSFFIIQAVSNSNLTNDDALSLRSMSVDETPGNSSAIY